jgi:spermidine/putrescine transport system ATP-binding protein
MQLELKRIQEEVGITFIYVTHDQDEAMTMSDRIAVMSAGRIEQLGDPSELYERPRTEFVAGFLGVSNLLAGSVMERDGESACVRLDDGALVSVPVADARAGGRVKVGVRPEKLRIAPGRDDGVFGDGLNRLHGVVVDASYVGVSTEYIVRTDDGHDLMVYAQNIETSGVTQVLADGQPVSISWRPQHSFVIDAEGETSPAGAPALDGDAHGGPTDADHGPRD